MLRFGAGWQSFSFPAPRSSTAAPATLQQANAVIGFDYQLAEQWLMRAETQPGVYGDRVRFDGRRFDAPLLVGVVYLIDADLQWFFGLRADFKSQYPVFPAAGVRWQFADLWTLNLMMPDTRLQYDVSSRLQAYLGAGVSAGTYVVGDHYGDDRGNPKLNHATLDFTELRLGPGVSWKPRAHSKLADHAAKLVIANADLEGFNATVFHDLCTPLTTISGYCQVIKELAKDRLDMQCLGYLEEIYDGTLRMKRLIASLLAFSQAARVDLHTEKFDLSAMAETIADGLQKGAPGRRATFRIAKGITGTGDAGLWRLALENLIGNAWKYSAHLEETAITIGTIGIHGERVCFVRDNGPGFDMTHADRLFAPFQRLPGEEVEGHGVGLATLERIVRRHGGKVWAESKTGEGATFYFTLE
ncbi:sensor histidine kinase [Geomonas sp. Red276]